MKIAFYVLGALVLTVLVVIGIGYRLPVKHSATVSARFRTSADSLFATITNLEGRASWRTGLTSVQSVPSTDGRSRFQEVSSDGTITYLVEASQVPHRYVTRIDDRSLPFGGTWTYDIAPSTDGATVLTIREDGEVYSPLFRFVSRYVFGHERTMQRYMSDLGRRFPQA
jgi:Polyketide cyclase / dehydrase and lipid transport